MRDIQFIDESDTGRNKQTSKTSVIPRKEDIRLFSIRPNATAEYLCCSAQFLYSRPVLIQVIFSD